MNIRRTVLIAGCLLVPVTLLVLPRYLKINTVNCRSQYGHCGNTVSEDLNSVKKESLFKTKRNIIRTLKAEFLVKDFQVYFKIPGTLDVDVIEKKPKYVIVSTQDNKKVLVDKDGFVLAGTDREDLPGITTTSSLPGKGAAVSRQELFAMNVMYDIYSLYQVKTGKIENDSLVIELPDDLRVIFPVDGDRQELVGEFMLLYNEIERKHGQNTPDTEKKISEIDLRFKNPILR